jgi:ceramide glucosyltransferase
MGNLGGHGQAWDLSMIWIVLLSALCLSATAYYAVSVVVGRGFARRAPTGRQPWPGISILKPIRGLDPDAFANFSSFCRQDYPRWEVLFGAEDENDPGLEAARRVQREHRQTSIRIVAGNGADGTNPKVRTLARLAREARHPFLLISDSDIRVGRSHLERMAEPLRDPRVGAVTCLYRTSADTFWGRLDSLALSTEFVPGVLVARRLEGMTFGMGSGILIRREVLERIGGFAALADSLADDYLLGNFSVRAGYRVELSSDIVDHRLGTRSLRDLLARQLRWNIAILTSRPWGYSGLLFTQGTTAALMLAIAAGGSAAALALAGVTLAARIGAAWFLTSRCLKDRQAQRLLWLLPIRDLLSTATWIMAFFSRTVVWRGRRFRIGSGGRLVPEPAGRLEPERGKPEPRVADGGLAR